MKRHYRLSRRTPGISGQALFLIASPFFCTLTFGCGPKADPATTDVTAAATNITATMTATSSSSVTDPSGVTLGVTTNNNGSSSTTAIPVPTTAEDPTCPVFLCGDFASPECDVFAQDCPDGKKCAAVVSEGGGAYDSVRCVPVNGTGVHGEPCTAASPNDGLDTCAKGNMCWELDDEGNGTCVALCMGTEEAPICPHMGLCTISRPVYLCSLGCDPLVQACPGFSGCYPIDDGFVCAVDASGDKGKANDPCESFNACDAGLQCADPDFVGTGCLPDLMGCCTPFCEFPGGACPNPDQQCVQLFDPLVLPKGDPQLAIGFCGVP